MTIQMIDLMGAHVMDEGQIAARGRDLGAANVPVPRQDELRNIMIAHIVGLRTAILEELAEVMQVQADMQTTKEAIDLTRIDTTHLKTILAYKQTTHRLNRPKYNNPATILQNELEVPHPDRLKDEQEREDALVILSTANQDTLDLYALRNPAPEEVEPSEGGEP